MCEEDNKKRQREDGGFCPLCDEAVEKLEHCSACKAEGCTNCLSEHKILGITITGSHVCSEIGELCTTCKWPFCPDETVECTFCDNELQQCRCFLPDICSDCLAPQEEIVKRTRLVQYQPVPGYAATLSRQVFVRAPVCNREVNGRDTPACLSAVADKDNADLTADMRLFDRGHLIALELDGVDHSHLIAPMNLQFNRSGAWRNMETTVGRLIDRTNAVDVAGKPVLAVPTGAKATLSLGKKNTLNTGCTLEITLFYDDWNGDSRVPVWFYVKLLRNSAMVTHFALANRGVPPKLEPADRAHGEFKAAAEIFTGLDLTGLARFVRDQEDLDLYVIGNATPAKPPNQLLQFMWEVNRVAIDKGLEQVFITLEQGNQKASTAYDTFQRRYLRVFNRWKNDGRLLSDVRTDNLYEDESADIWAELDECSGRAAPEVDHVAPSYQSGKNSYLNARLVSFQHNHSYREKKVLGSQPLNVTLMEMYDAGEASLMYRKRSYSGNASVASQLQVCVGTDPATLDHTGIADYLKELFADDELFDAKENYRQLSGNTDILPKGTLQHSLLLERQTFLRARAGLQIRQQKERAMKMVYTRLDKRHALAVDRATGDILDFQGNTLDSMISLAPLCSPSDKFGALSDTDAEDDEIQDKDTADKAYQAALDAMNLLKSALGMGN